MMGENSAGKILLACSLGGLGHLTPVVTVARAVARLGSDPVVLVPPSLSDEARRTGLAYHVGAEPSRAFINDVWSRVRAGPPEAVAGLIDRELFADRCTHAMLEAARDLCDRWKPQLIVRESCEYASAVAARERGLPIVQIGVSLAQIEAQVLDMVTPIVERYGAGVADVIKAAPYLSPLPASLDPSPWPDTRRFRPLPQPAAWLPDWWPGDHRPLIYVTFGTVVGDLPEATSAYRCALDAVATLNARVLLTVGRATDIPSVGTIPDNTRVKHWVPQADVLPHATLVVCHGGSATAFGALAAGVPLVICPLFADQSSNAKLIEAAGAGLVITGDAEPSGTLRRLSVRDVAPMRRAIERVLSDPTFRRAAQGLHAEITATPTVDALVE